MTKSISQRFENKIQTYIQRLTIKGSSFTYIEHKSINMRIYITSEINYNFDNL